ncbi:hypothetical protein NGM10_03015 [Halorussus salilacus]|uniref:hypothetical protein n=1 Tax=Halorussus salilacus TaxID=2953750 RepID=UPI00209E7E2A|nr:hypothetical protein [Halorussus salilacus]USZ68716.1 hypothetical protein NGM10_03015 [Halorussus salilacus]
MAVIDFVIGFVVSLLIGALGIYVGGRIITGIEDYGYAVITALIGSVVWWLVAVLVGWIPLLGTVLALAAWIYVINVRYPGGWGKAIGIALVAWLSVWVVLVVLGTLGLLTPDAIGVPGF